MSFPVNQVGIFLFRAFFDVTKMSFVSESSESDDNRAQMFVLKAGDKRGVVKKVKSPSKSK